MSKLYTVDQSWDHGYRCGLFGSDPVIIPDGMCDSMWLDGYKQGKYKFTYGDPDYTKK